ncbi:MAG: phosphatidate cytidylyltransferase [Anaerolineae bacterium]|nr:phosphatidate cytidylyltransferase [Candidatus Roseilinea sp.]MDW8448944.1 phosphatidate cytidylyltransferase [Anaerolineae bacterium]
MQTPSNDLTARLVSGAAVVVVTVVFGALGGWWFTLFVAAAIARATYELWRLLDRAGYRPSLAVAWGTAAAAFIGIRLPNLFILIPALTLVLLVSLARQLQRAQGAQAHTFGDWAVSFAGGFYLGWTGGHLAELIVLPPDGRWWLALTLATLWSADSMAYAFGRLLGKHKLAPAISPGKTWEGYIAGVIASTLAGVILGRFAPFGMPVGAIVGVLVGALSPLGDLIESMIKRQAHAKDSGNLIPGHGGVFDRIDSLLWASVVVTYVAVVASGTFQLP